MKIELHVPEGGTMTYVPDSNVDHMVCRVDAHAQLTVIYAPEQQMLLVQQTYVLHQASRLVFRGWFEYALCAQLEVVLQGAYAHADLKIGFKGIDATAVQLTTMQRHKAPHTTSSLLFKSLLADHAQTMHRGMIHVAESALDTHAKLHSNHMLKGSNAYAQVQPNLEVLTNEVQCAHGSAIGMFDADMLFYMQSRGLDEISAARLLEEAFFVEVR